MVSKLNIIYDIYDSKNLAVE